MKTFARLLIAFLVLGLAVTTNAQKIKVISGDMNSIKGEKKINVQYDFSNLTVGDYTEEEYVNKKVEEKNKKEAGTGDTWKEAWNNDKINKYEPKFEELMNKYLADAGITVGQDSVDTKYTIILKTTMIEPGYNVGVSRKPAFINVEIYLVANTDKTTNLCKMELKNVPGQDGMGYDFDTSYRISEAYAKCGKSLANYIVKNVFGK
jgi:hypothetical protein